MKGKVHGGACALDRLAGDHMGRLIGILLAVLPFALAWGGPLLAGAGNAALAQRIGYRCSAKSTQRGRHGSNSGQAV